MMAPDKLPIRAIANQAISDASLVFRTAPGLSIYAFVVFLIAVFLVPGEESELQDFVSDFVPILISCALLTPYYVAIHRLLILDEEPSFGQISPPARRFWYFLGASSLLALIDHSLFVAASLLNAPLGWITYTAVWIFMALAVVLWFPAIAVDAQPQTLSAAVEQARGLFLRLLGVFWLVFAPIWALFVIGSLIIPPMGPVFGSLALFFTLTAFVSVASRTWQWRQGIHSVKPAPASRRRARR